MILTVDKWADQLLADLNRSNDHKFKATVKDLIIQEYATIIKQTVEKNGYDSAILSGITVPMIRLNPPPIGFWKNNILSVSSVRLPQPVLYSNAKEAFTYVGGINGTSSFIPTTFDALAFNKYLPLVSEGVSYIYENGLIYIVSVAPIKQLEVRAIFADISDTYEEVVVPSNTTFNINSLEVVVKQRTDITLNIPLSVVNLVKYKLMNEELKYQETVKQEISDVDNN